MDLDEYVKSQFYNLISFTIDGYSDDIVFYKNICEECLLEYNKSEKLIWVRYFNFRILMENKKVSYSTNLVLSKIKKVLEEKFNTTHLNVNFSSIENRAEYLYTEINK